MSQKVKQKVIKTGILVFWMMLWQIGSMVMDQPILLPGPIEVCKTTVSLVVNLEFVQPLITSSYKIMIGFSLALISGGFLAGLSYRFRFFKELFMPPMKIIKAIPVASFVILALIWVGSSKLSILISFLMVLPLVYTNLYQGLEATDASLLEMAEVFRMKWYKKWYAIYLPSMLPFLETACIVGIGFCFKAGIAAEVIGIPQGSIGERLYEAKLYLMTKELFAWTILVIVISVLIEKLISLGIRGIKRLL